MLYIELLYFYEIFNQISQQVWGKGYDGSISSFDIMPVVKEYTRLRKEKEKADLSKLVDKYLLRRSSSSVNLFTPEYLEEIRDPRFKGQIAAGIRKLEIAGILSVKIWI